MGVIIASDFSLNMGIELFGKRAEETTTKELQAIHNMGTYEPQDASKLSKQEKRNALESFLFFTEKKDGRIKSRTCDMGNTHRTYDGYEKSAGSSPTVTTRGLILTKAIEAHQGRDVATVDIATAFLLAENYEGIIMKLRGKIVELVVQLEPTMYRNCVTTGPNGGPILYVKLLKALSGLLRSVLLFYKKLRKDLEDMGFEVNPYDPCVANKMINGSQMPVTWHVDGLKVSHKESTEVTTFIFALEKKIMAITYLSRV